MGKTKKIPIKKDLELTLGDIMDACQTMMESAQSEVQDGNSFNNSYVIDVFYPCGRMLAIEIKVLNPVALVKGVE